MAEGDGGMPAIRAVLLDLDDTLIHDRLATEAAVRAAAADLCAQEGLDGAAVASALRSAAGSLWASGPAAAYCRRIGISASEGLWGVFALGEDAETAALREFVPRYRRAAWAGALRALGRPAGADLCAQLAERFVHERAERQWLFPETLAVLSDLRAAGGQLCLLTNGDRDLQRRKAFAAGILPLLHHAVVSGELGVGKPEPAVFQHALGLCGVAAGEALMVGDSRARDIAGAVGAGLRAVWLDRFGEGGDPAGAWRVLPDLRPLPQLLGGEA